MSSLDECSLMFLPLRVDGFRVRLDSSKSESSSKKHVKTRWFGKRVGFFCFNSSERSSSNGKETRPRVHDRPESG
jgi:hypothetical protein